MRSDVMEFYGLTRSLRSAGYYETAHHKELLRDVKQAIYNGNLVVLSGVIGAGKTAAMAQLQDALAEEDRVAVSTSVSIEKNRVAIGTLVTAPGLSNAPYLRCAVIEGEQKIDAAATCSEAILGDGLGLIDAQEVVGKAAHPGEDAGRFADAGGIFGHGHIADVMQPILYVPMLADSAGGSFGRDGTIGKVERRLLRGGPQAGGGIAFEDRAFDLDDGLYIRIPGGAGEGLSGVEDARDAGLVAVALVLIHRSMAGERLGGPAMICGLLQEGRLVLLDLNNQMCASLFGGLECFFWQWRASSVMT